MGRFKGTLKEVATLLSGSVVAQAITLVAYFVLLRIYTPADYGLFSIFYSYIEVLVIASTCKYELAVVAAEDDHEAAAVVRFGLRLNMLVSLGLLALLAVLTLTGLMPERLSRLGWLAPLMAPLVFLVGNNRMYAGLYNRMHRYSAIAASDVVGSVSAAVFKAVLGLLGMNRAGLPIGAVLGQAAANVNYRIGLRRLALPDTSRAAARAAARRHANYPRYVATKDFVNSLSTNLPFLWLALYFDGSLAGLFAIAVTFVMQPCRMVGAAFERVLFARSSEVVHGERRLWDSTLRFLLCVEGVAVAVGIMLWFFAEPLFGFCFGGRWAGCGVYVQALLPWAVVTAGQASLMYIPNLFSTQRIEFFIYLGELLMRIAAVAAGIVQGDFLLAIRLFTAVSALTSLVLLVWYLAQVRRYERSLQ